jgi:hypothetical protein
VPVIVAVPWSGVPIESTLRVSPSGSVSLASTSTSTVPRYPTTSVSSATTGTVLPTTTWTLPVAVPPCPSEMVYVNVAVPCQLGDGGV